MTLIRDIQVSAIAKTRIEVGCLLYGQMRRFLEETKYNHPEIEWSEGSGLLSRIFYIRGPEQTVRSIAAILKKRFEVKQ